MISNHRHCIVCGRSILRKRGERLCGFMRRKYCKDACKRMQAMLKRAVIEGLSAQPFPRPNRSLWREFRNDRLPLTY